jgi:toxin ParE1/3/4
VKFRIARTAERDLEDIGDWIARRDPNAAARFTAELEAKARQIALMPYAFPTVSSVPGGRFRKRSHRRYIIYYRVSPTTVTLIRILRHSRDQIAQLRNP